jgi:cell division protein FtsN
MKFERGGFALGLVAGLLIGLALALGVALYITKAPLPFIDKVPQRTVEQDAAETERNKTWNPNAPLAPQLPPVGAASAPSTASAPGTGAAPVTGAVSPSPRDPAAILSGGDVSTAPAVAAFTYFVQVGAYTREADAESQRAGLAIQGFTAKVYEREQAGRTVYRVRLGPFDAKSEADAQQLRLKSAGLDAQLVRVQKS